MRDSILGIDNVKLAADFCAGEQSDGKLAAALLKRCASLEEALRSSIRQLEDAKAAEVLLQSRNSILRAENVTLAARFALESAISSNWLHIAIAA